MILQLSLFQIFFMALSIVGLSFSILYLFIGGHNYENGYETPEVRVRPRQKEKSSRETAENVVDIKSARRRAAPVQKPAPTYRTSVGRQTRVTDPALRVLEVDYKVVKHRSRWDEVTLDAISEITDRVATSR